MVNSHHDIEEDDHISIDAEAFSDALFRVSDKQVDDIGITETLAVTLLSDSAGTWALVGTTSDSQVTLEEIDGDGEVQVFWQQIEKE
jgi:hypothetical protein